MSRKKEAEVAAPIIYFGGISRSRASSILQRVKKKAQFVSHPGFTFGRPSFKGHLILPPSASTI